MPTPLRHAWDLTAERAAHLQEKLAGLVIEADEMGPVRAIAGADVSSGHDNPRVRAAVIILDATTLRPLDLATAEPAGHPADRHTHFLRAAGLARCRGLCLVGWRFVHAASSAASSPPTVSQSTRRREAVQIRRLPLPGHVESSGACLPDQ